MRWIDVNEILPQEDGEYLVWRKHSWGECCTILEFRKSYLEEMTDTKLSNVFLDYDSDWGYMLCAGITHWMPLPNKPKKGEKV